jgi:ribosomal-protein-alanine N-acetyltransferase
MNRTSALTIRAANSDDWQLLANLIHFGTLVHRHLDWRPPLDWIGLRPYLVAEQGHELVAAMACPPDPPDISWIRLFAVSGLIDAEEAWQELWWPARAQLFEHRQVVVVAIPLQEWFRQLLQSSGFSLTNRVMMLVWESGNLPAEHKLADVRIRPMNFDDLDPVEALDTSAFGPVWRNSRASLELAFRQAAVATVAEADGELAGYQISTASHLGGHLARLAVKPELQGRGIGYGLVRDMLDQFERRGARRITVNTQQDNLPSLALYERAGFRPTGENYPVYQYQVGG